MSHIFAFISASTEIPLEDVFALQESLGAFPSLTHGRGSASDVSNVGIVYYDDATCTEYLPQITLDRPRPVLYRREYAGQPTLIPRSPAWSSSSSRAHPYTVDPDLTRHERPVGSFSRPYGSDCASVEAPSSATSTAVMTPATTRPSSPIQVPVLRSPDGQSVSVNRLVAVKTRSALICVHSQDVRPAVKTAEANPSSTHAGLAGSDNIEALVRQLPTDRFGLSTQPQPVTLFSDDRSLRFGAFAAARRVVNGPQFHRERNLVRLCKRVVRDSLEAFEVPATPAQTSPIISGQFSIAMLGRVGDFTLVARESDPLSHLGARRRLDPARTEVEFVKARLCKRLGQQNSTGRQPESSVDAREMADELIKDMNELMWRQRQLLGKHAEANSLSLVVKSHRELIAVRFCNDVFEQPPPLFYTASVRASRTTSAAQVSGEDNMIPTDTGVCNDLVLITSDVSPEAKPRWCAIKKNTILLVDSSGNLSTKLIEYPLGLNTQHGRSETISSKT